MFWSGHTLTIAAELWGVFYGLKAYWELQKKSIWVETDSALMCSLLQNTFKQTSKHQSLVQSICNMIEQD